MSDDVDDATSVVPAREVGEFSSSSSNNWTDGLGRINPRRSMTVAVDDDDDDGANVEVDERVDSSRICHLSVSVDDDDVVVRRSSCTT